MLRAVGLGLAVLTAIFTTQQVQQMAGRAAMLPANTATPHLDGPPVPDWVGVYATYQQTQLQVFVGGLDDLFLIAAGLTALGALGALLLRSGPARLTPDQPRSAPEAQLPPAKAGRYADQRPPASVAQGVMGR